MIRARAPVRTTLVISLASAALFACGVGGGGAGSAGPPVTLDTAATLNLPQGSFVKIAVVPDGVAIDGRRYVILVKTEAARPVVSIDVTDPANPVVAQELGIKGWVRDIAIQGSHAYVSSGQGDGFVVLDVSSPTAMQVAGHVDVGNASGVAVSGTHAFVGLLGAPSWGDNLRVVDISDPANPTVVASGAFTTPPPEAVPEDTAWARSDRMVVAGGILYAANGKTGLDILDVSDPLAPALLANVPPPAPPPSPDPSEEWAANDVFVSGATAYVASGGGMLQIVDVTDAASPAVLGTYADDLLDVHGVSGWGTHLCLVGYKPSGGKVHPYARILDALAPTSFATVGEYIDPVARSPHVGAYDFSCPGTAYAGTACVYVADDFFGLRIFDVADYAAPVPPAFDSSVFTFGEIRDVHVRGNAAYVLYSPNNVLGILDVSDPAHPALVGLLPTNTGDASNRHNLAARGTVLYVAGNEHTAVLDASDPAQPALVSTLALSGTGTKLAVAGSRLYVSYVGDGTPNLHLRIYDAAAPLAPAQLSDIVLSSATAKVGGTVAVDGARVYVHEAGILYGIDASDPANPAIAGQVATDALDFGVTGPTTFDPEFAVQGDAIYMARPPQVETGQSNPNDIAVLDVSAFPAVVVQGYLSFPWPLEGHALRVVNGRLFVADGALGQGILVFDVSDRFAPHLVAEEPASAPGIHEAYDFDFLGNDLLLAEVDRVRVIPLPSGFAP
ncbi:MAG TPA: hypothetical protein VFI25_09355 [Planctomycetota bacterium]|nr:hypothetical protein [Planctomycetota bacterium]